MNEEKLKSPAVCVALGFILLLGLYLRVAGLSTLGPGFDEPIHIYAAMSILQTGEPTLPSGFEYTRSLLFTSLVAVSFKIMGASLFAARMPSVLFSMFSILLLFKIGSDFFGRKVGLAAAFLMAFVPFEVSWARACRMYSMYQFFYLGAFYAFYRAFESRETPSPDAAHGGGRPFLARLVCTWGLKWNWLIVCMASFGIAFHLQHLAGVFPLSVLIYLLAMLVVTLPGKSKEQFLRSKYFVFSSAIVFAMTIALLIPQVQSQFIEHYSYTPEWNKSVGTSATRYFNYLISPMLFPFMVFFALGSIELLSRWNKEGFYTLVITATPLAVHSFAVNVQGWRYVYDIFPLVLLIAGYAISSFGEKTVSLVVDSFRTIEWRSQTMRKSCIVLSMSLLFVVFSVPFLYTAHGALKLSRNQDGNYGAEYHADWEKACRFLNGARQSGEIVVASIPIAAMYCGCDEVQYKLDNGGMDLFRHVEGSDLSLDVYSNAMAITSLDELKRVLSEHRYGWLLVDVQRFDNPSTIPPPIRGFVEKYFTYRYKANGTILVFSWNPDVVSQAGLLAVSAQ
ncbi:MAG: glycosyltransferase family 39 protein [Syntrophobacteraceae bacterium]|nr:glycosyltransferase family 39 protein [Desulfobacteraceae bacterium]